MASAKDQKFNMVMSADDKAALAALADADDVSEAHVVRSLVRHAYLERFGEKRPKKR